MGNHVSEISKQIDGLKFNLSRNAMYNAAREGWYASLHKLVMFTSAFSGTGAAVTVLGEWNSVISVFFGLFVAFATTSDLVFNLSGNARLHNGLRQRYFSLLAELESSEIDQELLKSINDRLYRIYGEEPPTMRALDAMMWNQARLSLYEDVNDADLISLKWNEKFFCQLWAFHHQRFHEGSKQ